jgi:SAM-dependent methyltransferase
VNPLRYSSHNWLAMRINNESLRRHLGVLRGLVLDLGCGEAPYEPDIVARSCEYLGVDWPRSLHGKGRVRAFVDLGAPLPFCDQSADTITAFQVLEHVPEPGLVLAECRRVLRRGGALLLTVPFMWHVHEAPRDYFRFTRHGLERLLREHGFDELRIEANTGFWQTAVLKLNYHSLRIAKGPLRWLFVPFWWLGQAVAPLLDKISPSEEETASYTVVAR